MEYSLFSFFDHLFLYICHMSALSRIYKNNLNGIILTLVFHILVFSGLNLSQIKIRKEYKEPEIIIDFSSTKIIEQKLSQAKENGDAGTSVKKGSSGQMTTNVASNKSATRQNQSVDNQFQEEIEKARELVKNVSSQLKKDIPTVDDIKMPEASKVNPEKFSDKVYTGESNIEYYLEKRYHIRLPIPVYLAEGGGKVRVNIAVDRSGNVIKAEPVVTPNLSEQLLSYAKTAALRTEFNPDNNAPALQNGYITYNFVPQR